MTHLPEDPRRVRASVPRLELAPEAAKPEDRRATWFVLGTVALAVVWTTLAWRGPLTGDLAFWFVASVLGELLWIRLPMGSATLSMGSCSQFAAVLLLPRGQAMAVVAASVAIVEASVLRKPAQRVAFNAAQAALSAATASLVLSPFGGGGAVLHDLSRPSSGLALLLAALAYFALNSGSVSIAVALTEATSPLAAWRRNFGNRYELLSSAALFSLGALLASHYLHAGIVGAFLVICPLVLAFQGYRLHSLQRIPQESRGHDGQSTATELEVKEALPRWE